MKSLQGIEKKLFKIKPILFSKYPIEKLAIIDSYFEPELSGIFDIHILVEFNKPIGILFFDMAEELEKYLKMEVNLVSKNGIKPDRFKEIELDLIYI